MADESEESIFVGPCDCDRCQGAMMTTALMTITQHTPPRALAQALVILTAVFKKTKPGLWEEAEKDLAGRVEIIATEPNPVPNKKPEHGGH